MLMMRRWCGEGELGRRREDADAVGWNKKNKKHTTQCGEQNQKSFKTPWPSIKHVPSTSENSLVPWGGVWIRRGSAVKQSWRRTGVVTYLHSSVHVSCSEHSAACAMTQHKSRSVQMPMILRRFWIKKNPHGSGAQGSRLHCFLVRAQRRQDPNRQ